MYGKQEEGTFESVEDGWHGPGGLGAGVVVVVEATIVVAVFRPHLGLP